MDIRCTPGAQLAKGVTGEAVNTPPESAVRLRDMLANRERFFNNQTALDPLIRMAMGYYRG